MMIQDRIQRSLPVGAELLTDVGGVHFRVWAPKRRRVEVVFEGGPDSVRLDNEDNGYFSGLAAEARAGSRYKLRLDGGDAFPDPVSRFQPDGVHGPSQVVDPRAFKWTDDTWPGVGAAGQVLYELHIGTFTREGTWRSAIEQLQSLKDLGVTCLEVMPVAEFAGDFGWGYDGVQLFAPYHHYGSADDFRRFVDRCHAIGLGVILDVVYNHLGPDGNYLGVYSDTYFSKTHRTDWGDALNFDNEGSHGVREYFLANVRHWIEEYHLDGFRFDATQAIIDTKSPKHILAEITETARRSGGEKKVYLANENEPQETRLVRPIDAGGYGMDALWNDDFHHSAMVAVSGHDEAYYTDTPGTPQEFISAAKWGYLYQGQRYKWQKKRRGTPALDLPPTAFVHFLQNHDQIANSGRGYRLHQIASPAEAKAMTALLLLMPQTPMLFQGQEFAASSTFHYFANHNAELTKLICAGRAREMSQFPSVATESMQACLVDPGAEETFLRSKIDHAERERGMHKWFYDLHKDLLALRRGEACFRRVQRRGDIDGAVLGAGAFVLRYFGVDGGDDHLVLVNFARDLQLDPAPEPLLAPPMGKRWQMIFTSEDPKYGGSGTAPVDTEQEGFFLPGRTTVVLRPAPVEQAAVQSRFRVQGSAQDAKIKSPCE